MGSTVCSKCGVDIKYYNGRDPGNSCHIHDCENNCPSCGNYANCFHRFEYRFFGIPFKNNNNIVKNNNSIDKSNDIIKNNDNDKLNILLSKHIKT